MVLVLGNGESRAGADLTKFDYEVLIGCNAAYRDLTLDYLVCCDTRMVKEATGNTSAKIYSRDNLPDLPYQGNDRADMPVHWGSGPYAVLLAATLSNNITLLGFDLYGTDNRVNNLYKGTANYSKPDSHAVDYSYWVYQIGQVFKHFPTTSFTVINKEGWMLPEEWILPNVKFSSLQG